MKKLAYLVLAHNDPQHFKKLVKALNLNCDIYVHIDIKADIKNFLVDEEKGRISFLTERVDISWAGISMVKATIELMKLALKRADEYSHLILLSGADYPIKSQQFIYDFFMESPDKNYIKYIDMRESPDHYMQQITRKWYQEPIIKSQHKPLKLIDKVLRKILRELKLNNKWDRNLVPYFGSQWWALTAECCLYLMMYIESNADYLTTNKDTFSPDEHFFHTLVGNSVFADKSLGKQPFTGRGTYKMANLHVIDQTLNKWFAAEDIPQLLESDKLFARKLNTAKSSELVEKFSQLANARQV